MFLLPNINYLIFIFIIILLMLIIDSSIINLLQIFKFDIFNDC